MGVILKNLAKAVGIIALLCCSSCHGWPKERCDHLTYDCARICAMAKRGTNHFRKIEDMQQVDPITSEKTLAEIAKLNKEINLVSAQLSESMPSSVPLNEWGDLVISQDAYAQRWSQQNGQFFKSAKDILQNHPALSYLIIELPGVKLFLLRLGPRQAELVVSLSHGPDAMMPQPRDGVMIIGCDSNSLDLEYEKGVQGLGVRYVRLGFGGAPNDSWSGLCSPGKTRCFPIALD